MPSIRARLTSAFLRLTLKPLWKPGLDLAHVRAHAARSDRRMGRPTRPLVTQAAAVAGVQRLSGPRTGAGYLRAREVGGWPVRRGAAGVSNHGAG